MSYLTTLVVTLFVSSLFIGGGHAELRATEILLSCDFSRDMCGWTDHGLSECVVSNSTYIPKISPRSGIVGFLSCGTEGEEITALVLSPEISSVNYPYVKMSFWLWVDNDVIFTVSNKARTGDRALWSSSDHPELVTPNAWSLIENTLTKADFGEDGLQVQLEFHTTRFKVETSAAVSQFRLLGMDDVTEGTTGVPIIDPITSGLPIWSIVLIVIGSLVIVGALIALIVYLVKRPRSQFV